MEMLARIDFTDFLTALAVAGVVGVLAWPLKAWRGIYRWIRRQNALRRYRRSLERESTNLIIVGKRDGQKLNDVFIELDVARSALSRASRNPAEPVTLPAWWSSSCVLVGGPGAGKSTLMKHRVLHELGSSTTEHAPMLFRLRNYVGFAGIEEALQSRLSMYPQQLCQDQVVRWLRNPKSLVVLDGLDEVPADKLQTVLEHINVFYSKHCDGGTRIVVTCRREAYQSRMLGIDEVVEVLPMTDAQIRQFATRWPAGYPHGKSAESFWRDVEGNSHIRELARSPLLLVGGLMQYTESNRGVPEERHQYLERVAQWLLVEWATAQGHPHDPYRQLYERLLARLASEMHARESPHIGSEEALTLVARWLPDFGAPANEAGSVLESVRTRTGILVREDESRIVFAQFALQEYFASREISARPFSEHMIKSPRWEEPILLAVAQLKEPDAAFKQLFELNPLLAVRAVAEHPTPSLDTQRRAMVVSLERAEKADRAATSGIAALLSKASGAIAAEFASKLETLLKSDRKRARVVGAALASAGTPDAIAILSRHPDAWEDSLAENGFISEAFAELLQRLIADGSERDSALAAELLTGNARFAVFTSLAELLPKLKPNKASNLAAKLCGRVLRQAARFHLPAGDRLLLPIVAGCLPYLRNAPDLARSVAFEISAEEWDARSGARPKSYHDRRYRHRDVIRVASRTAVFFAMYVTDKGDKNALRRRIDAAVKCSVAWQDSRDFLLAMFGAGVLLALPPAALGSSFTATLTLALAVIIAAVPESVVPWRKVGRAHVNRRISVPAAVSFVACGAVCASAVFVPTRGMQSLVAFMLPGLALLSRAELPAVPNALSEIGETRFEDLLATVSAIASVVATSFVLIGVPVVSSFGFTALNDWVSKGVGIALLGVAFSVAVVLLAKRQVAVRAVRRMNQDLASSIGS